MYTTLASLSFSQEDRYPERFLCTIVELFGEVAWLNPEHEVSLHQNEKEAK